jgi:hypothetical protein
MVPAAINVLVIVFCPESPRWLYSVGKTEQARKVLAQLHSETGDINSPLIQLEMEEIIEKLEVDGPDSTCLSPHLHSSNSNQFIDHREMVGLQAAFQDTLRSVPHWYDRSYRYLRSTVWKRFNHVLPSCASAHGGYRIADEEAYAYVRELDHVILGSNNRMWASFLEVVGVPIGRAVYRVHQSSIDLDGAGCF